MLSLQGVSSQPLMQYQLEHDYPVSLGGATACVIAGRLAAADPSLKILILEAGPHTRDLDKHRQPGRYLSHLHPSSKTMTFNVAKPSDHIGGRAAIVSCGHCVGGGSSVNCMLSFYGALWALTLYFKL